MKVEVLSDWSFAFHDMTNMHEQRPSMCIRICHGDHEPRLLRDAARSAIRCCSTVKQTAP